jgi:hypothetical protein
MTRNELIRRFVLNSFCDDYEDIEQITKAIDEEGPAGGLTISHDEIVQALRELIELGYAKAWDLQRWPDPPTTDNQETPPREDITPLNPRFARTEGGVAFHKASSPSGTFDESWPAPETPFRREELIRLFILGSYRSYPNCTHVRLWDIERLWNGMAERHRISISRDEFIQALRDLVGLGYLNASYKDEGWQYDGMPPLEEIKPFGAYFWVTGPGWDFLNSDPSWWPFEDSDDDELKLRKDWVPPTD